MPFVAQGCLRPSGGVVVLARTHGLSLWSVRLLAILQPPLHHQVELRVSRMLSVPGAEAGAASGMPGIGGHPIRGGPITSRSLAVPTGTRIQVGEIIQCNSVPFMIDEYTQVTTETLYAL